MWEEASLCQPSIHTPLCTVKYCFYARYPGQTFWRSFGRTDKDARVWWDTDLPFPSSTGMPFHCKMMNGYTCMPHIWSVHTHTHMQKTYKQPLSSGQPSFGIALHTQTHNNTKTGRHPYCSTAIFRARCRRKGGIRLCLLAAPLVFSKLPCLLGTSTQTDAVLSALGNSQGLWVFSERPTTLHKQTNLCLWIRSRHTNAHIRPANLKNTFAC